VAYVYHPDREETVRIRDKAVVGGSRIVNKSSLSQSDLILEEKPDKGKSDQEGN
jgi:hypothetical protein